MTHVIETVEIGKAFGDQLEVTMRGTAQQIVGVLVNGLPREALEQVRYAMEAELAKRRDEAQSAEVTPEDRT